jgi:hypothetical protein
MSIQDLIDKIDSLQTEIEFLKEQVRLINLKCDKMTNHIDFVDNTYSKIKKPFNYIVEKTSKFIESVDTSGFELDS